MPRLSCKSGWGISTLEDLNLLDLRFGAFLDTDGEESVFEFRREFGRVCHLRKINAHRIVAAFELRREICFVMTPKVNCEDI